MDDPGRHPVIEEIERRRAGGPRDPETKLALVIEGGGMRGVVCGGMVAALEALGLTEIFDEVIGSSAGAIAGAYFVAGQAAFGTRIFYEEINNRRFIWKPRLFMGRAVVSVDFLLDDVCRNAKRLDWQAVLAARSRLICIAANLDRECSAALTDFADREALFQAMKASARIPAVAGPPVLIGGERHVDAGVYENIPVVTAQSRGATHMVTLLTRPDGPAANELEPVEKLLVVPWLNRRKRGAGERYRTSPARYATEIEAARALSPMPDGPAVLPVVLPGDRLEISNVETDRRILQAGAWDGFCAVYRAFGLEPPGQHPPLHLDALHGAP